MKKIYLIVLSYWASCGCFAENFFYDLDDDYSAKTENSFSNKKKSPKSPNVNTVKTSRRVSYPMQYHSVNRSDHEYEIKPYRPSYTKPEVKASKTKPQKSEKKKQQSNSDCEDSKYLIRENTRLTRENTKLLNELKRCIEANTKAIADLNKRLDEYENS